ncbi:predicted PLP-dependent enzyme possibly involved in cell wall biogenesis [Chthonomonas calidirosea]|uniref:DegT/DnrJ/EryC1/StrS family aminotransferase n=1 Tax=Chthonomonas calidirosea TaxID=454171 RepID=UPI0006DD4988|nr:DegT/DnrJ/EryC1/StrS family aminotransferase [Chthonomonas calidirosea]CEK13505.1 predicted PLP-dependent enzyme possibly involved in cell wall biogenesis [Chthonomonas calidirosea]
MFATTQELLAINGGKPVRDRQRHPWPRWPIFGHAEEQALKRALQSGQWWYVGGVEGVSFEKEFATFQQAQYGVACTNGTAAIEIAIRSLNIGYGDEVIVPSYTFIASASAPLMAGALPVFVDVDPQTYNIDPDQVEAAITPRTKAIIAVHLTGRPADMDRLLEIAKRHNLYLIEDAAQAHGAEWRGRRVGALGDLGTFSFQASKNLNAGEGGIVLSNNEALADAAWSIMNVGRSRGGQWYEHPFPGSNYRMTEFQAALLRVQLQRLPQQIQLRSRNAAYLRQLLAQIHGILLPLEDERITCQSYHLYAFRYQKDAFGGHSLEEFLRALNAEGIPSMSTYRPLYQQPIFAHHAARLAALTDGKITMDYTKIHHPVCEQLCAECVWLPQYVLLGTQQDVEDIATAIARIQKAWT